MSSNAHKPAKINLDDLQHEKRYRKWIVYGETKLANLLFAYEFQRRLAAANAPLISVAAHPGTAATNLVRVSAGSNPIKAAVMTVGARVISQSGAMGALPQLYAATAPEVQGGEYFGPSGIAEQFGYPKKVDSTDASKSVEDAKRLWEMSEQLTGVSYAGLAG